MFFVHSRGRVDPTTHLLAGVLGPALAVAGVWGMAFAIRLMTTPPGWWTWRDDAVITLSHARNWAEFGTFGVSPGDRSEGFSSPLHALLTAGLYRMSSIGYEATTMLILAVSVGVSGVCAAVIVRGAARDFGISAPRAIRLSVVLGGAVGVCTAMAWSSVGWIGSGMENAVIVALMLLIAALALNISGRPLGMVALATALVSLGVARVEFAAVSVPVLLGAAWVVLSRTSRSNRGWVVGVLVVLPLTMWATIHVGRWLYFGDFFPTTALAQGKSVGVTSLVWLAALSLMWLMLLFGTTRTASTTSIHSLPWLIIAVGSTLAFGDALITQRVISEPRLSVMFALCAGAAWLTFARTMGGHPWRPDALFAALALAPVAQYLAMGPARMDPLRVAFLALPVLAVWCAAGLTWPLSQWRRAIVAVPHAAEGSGTDDPPLRTTQPMAVRVGAAMGIAAVIVAPATALVYDPAVKLGWEINAEPMLDGISEFADDKLPADALPIGANPDLGEVSFAKSTQLVDLGYLGEPLLARLNARRPDLRSLYLAEVVKPDVVQTHGILSCSYGDWLGAPGFVRDYEIVESLPASSSFTGCPNEGALTVWYRRDDPELTLTAAIAASPQPQVAVREALRQCSRTDNSISPFRCESVMRAVWRLTANLQESGHFDAVVAEFEYSPSGNLDQLILSRPPGWAEQAFVEFTALADSAPE